MYRLPLDWRHWPPDAGLDTRNALQKWIKPSGLKPQATSAGRELGLPTHRSRWLFSGRTAGLPWNLTFADAAAKVRDGDSSHSRVAITDLSKVPPERLHPTAAY